MLDQPLVGDEVAVGDLHALGCRGRARGVLQERHVVGPEVRPAPGTLGTRCRCGSREHGCPRPEGSTDRLAQSGLGQDQPGLGVLDDEAQPLQVLRLRRLGRIGRHRDHAGEQAAIEAGHIVEPAREQQHAPGRRVPSAPAAMPPSRGRGPRARGRSGPPCRHPRPGSAAPPGRAPGPRAPAAPGRARLVIGSGRSRKRAPAQEAACPSMCRRRLKGRMSVQTSSI